MIRPRLLGLVLLGLGACTPVPPLSERLQPWIGRSELDLVSAFGVPSGTYVVDGVKFIQFTGQRTVLAPTPAPALAPYGFWGPAWAGAFAQPMVVSCEVTFALRQGVAESVSFRGQGCR